MIWKKVLHLISLNLAKYLKLGRNVGNKLTAKIELKRVRDSNCNWRILTADSNIFFLPFGKSFLLCSCLFLFYYTIEKFAIDTKTNYFYYQLFSMDSVIRNRFRFQFQVDYLYAGPYAWQSKGKKWLFNRRLSGKYLFENRKIGKL